MMVVCTIQYVSLHLYTRNSKLIYRFTCEQTVANIERADAIYEEHIRELLDSAYTGFGVIELMASVLSLTDMGLSLMIR